MQGEDLRSELTSDRAATAVLQLRGRTVDIRADDEETLLRDTVDALPAVEEITAERFKVRDEYLL